MSDSVRPHRQQPTRLPRPWDSPGKNTGVGCHFLLQWLKVKSESEVAQSCLTLSDPMDCSPPGTSVHGILQAKVLQRGTILTIYKRCVYTPEFFKGCLATSVIQDDCPVYKLPTIKFFLLFLSFSFLLRISHIHTKRISQLGMEGLNKGSQKIQISS